MSSAPPVVDAPTIGDTGVTPALLEALLPHLAESLMVLDADWNVVANLAPPGGLIGRGLGIGVHTLEDMHPDDALQVLELGTQAFSRPGWTGSMVVRMRRGDGGYGRYEITATNRFDDPAVGGMVVRTREVAHDGGLDVPDAEARRVVETLAEVLPLGVVLLEPSGRPIFANGAACGMLGREPEDLKRRGLALSIREDDRSLLEGVVARTTSAVGREACTVRLDRPGERLVECTFTSDGGDAVTVVVVTLEDVTERIAVHADLERRATLDELTGLRNRAALHDDLRARLEAGEELVVAYVDLDGFKAVNDRLGHAGGDGLLAAVGAALRAGAGPGQEVGRIGGDEFVVLIPAPGPGGEEALAAELAATVAAVPAARIAGVTASVGLARSRPGDTVRALLHRADQAMYAAKARRPPG